MKKCNECDKEKPLEDFGKDKHTKDGLNYLCKKCRNKKARSRIKRKISHTCLKCKETRELDYYTHQRRKHDFCFKCSPTEVQSGEVRPQSSRSNSGRWKGGSYISSDGYRMVLCEGQYHPSGRQKYKKEHILVMEQHIGRELDTCKGGGGECVHHIDGDKLNNSIDNLELCIDTRDHRNLHYSLQRVAYELVQNGTIAFNKEKREYERIK